MRGRDLGVLYLLSLLWHVAWACNTPGPTDWDVSYYFGVAERIVAGKGATTDAVWNPAWLPTTLLHPADLHWMPLASRVLVPAVWLADRWGTSAFCAAQLTACLCGAGQAVLAALFVVGVGGERRLAWIAGIIAGTGLGFVRFLAVPDSIALYGLLAGAAWLCVAQGRPAMAGVASALAALTRSEGALVGICVAIGLGLRGDRRAWMGLFGPLASLLWSLRCQLLVGDGYTALRSRVFNASNAEEWIAISDPIPLGGLARVAILADHAGDLLKTPFAAFALLLPFVLLSARGVWEKGAAPVLYALGMPLLLYGIAPSVAIEGSVFRSSACLVAPLVAIGVVGLSRALLRYHFLFLPCLYAVLQLLVVMAIGAGSRQFPPPFPDCQVMDAAGVPAGAPILSYDPIGTSARCGHPGVILAAGARDVDVLADRYGIRYALTAPADYDSWTAQEDDFDAEGWVRIEGGRVFRRE